MNITIQILFLFSISTFFLYGCKPKNLSTTKQGSPSTGPVQDGDPTSLESFDDISKEGKYHFVGIVKDENAFSDYLEDRSSKDFANLVNEGSIEPLREGKRRFFRKKKRVKNLMRKYEALD